MKLVGFEHRGRQLVGELRDSSVVTKDEEIPLSEITYLPPITNPRKIICIGINYEAHRVETGREKSPYPVVFTRFATTLVGHEEPIVRPRASECLDYEGELAVIIGREARHVKAERALEIVAGYACFNDASVRDWQYRNSQFTPGKNFDATGAFGPWMVTADEIPDPSQLELTTRVNGERVQHAFTSDMTFSVPQLIEYISTFCTLEPGDVIATGTPGGVGHERKPPLFLKPGDRVEVEIDKIGVLSNPVEAE
jgi:2-keto-4-pentenoate hydratase/2-oxohepta-3-ene-1,7-dioic acid hydratase in catechol pathway